MTLNTLVFLSLFHAETDAVKFTRVNSMFVFNSEKNLYNCQNIQLKPDCRIVCDCNWWGRNTDTNYAVIIRQRLIFGEKNECLRT